MVNISIRYTGELHCAATHGPSKTEIATDAPLDNKGKGAAFSPTDLVATALGSCIGTTMAIVAEQHGVDLTGMTVQVGKEMSKDAPRRIVALPNEVHIPLPPSTPQRELLEKAGLNCPVHQSLPSEIARATKFFWEG
ncbi:MAG: OsmC family protein [Verrucomicrobiota bacterium]|nr:OsmC family protein [Verrucomicrobiota bacterium]